MSAVFNKKEGCRSVGRSERERWPHFQLFYNNFRKCVKIEIQLCFELSTMLNVPPPADQDYDGSIPTTQLDCEASWDSICVLSIIFPVKPDYF
jgi:hypothetical protein